MHRSAILIIALVACFGCASAVASNTLADCWTVANSFANTCNVTAGPLASIPAHAGKNVVCTNLPASNCPGTLASGTCTFAQKLCITCSSVSGVTRIRVQTNSLPPRCVGPSAQSITQQEIDFTTNFNPQVSYDSLNVNVAGKTATEAVLCNVNAHSTVPSYANFVKTSTGNQNTVMGVMIDGVLMLNENNMFNQDPFYPAVGGVPVVDQCISHPSPTGADYHYHGISPCMFPNNYPTGDVVLCSAYPQCNSGVKAWMMTGLASYHNLTVIGIGRDGHVIFGPYDSAGNRITTGTDVCNGMFYDNNGNYGYFATDTFPYVSGCFGPANYPCAQPTSCTTNPAATLSPSTYVRNNFNVTTCTSAAQNSKIASFVAIGLMALVALVLTF